MDKIRRLTLRGLTKTKKFIDQEEVKAKLLQIINVLVPCLLLLCFSIVIYEFGYKPFWSNTTKIDFWLSLLLRLTAILIAIRLALGALVKKRSWVKFFTLGGLLSLLAISFYLLPVKASLTDTTTTYFFFSKLITYGVVILAFITEISYFFQFIYTKSIHPGLLFVGSFAFLILTGSFLLKLPVATYGGISETDALFTATSAVCVTGLIVVDTATYFTPFGQLIILSLIQVGGLGIMTFAGLLAYAVAGQTSFKAQLAFKDMMNSNQINHVMSFVYQVVAVTLLFELMGAVVIFLSLEDALFSDPLHKAFFSVFHAVSAFCNAGFSTYTNGLYELPIRFNYSLHLTIAVLIILGGLGFPIVFNLYRYAKVKTSNLVCKIRGRGQVEHYPNIIYVNGRLALLVSFILLLFGFIAYFLFERTATLQQHPTWTGKLITSFFGSVTPRTAGFNSVDLTKMNLSTILIYLFLMWIGASPGSTGGGIKTTTAGVAFLNLIAILRGRDRAEIFRTEISQNSVRRAFAIISLSLLMIGTAVLLIAATDREKGLIAIAFEVFSAFSTVGLSLGITANLSIYSKIVLMVTMFIGRVGMITLLVAFIKQSRKLYYLYPKEEITF